MDEPRRLRIAGLHHVTVLCESLERSTALYRNLLGMRMVRQTVSDDDPEARHLIFGDDHGSRGTLITCLEYPQLEKGTVGVGSTHHFALAVESEEELRAWRDYLNAQGAPCTDVLERDFSKSIYLRDPDGHLVELATSAARLVPDEG